MKKLVLRFDIDTYRCINQGVPNLLDLARQEQVKFTFFCNMGRAVSRVALLKKLIRSDRSRQTEDSAPKLATAAKLGYPEIIRTLLLNPKVGCSRPDLVRRIREEGHDLGLHGGRNHGAWQHGFRNWQPGRIRGEVSAGCAMFQAVVGTPPTLFSSPGWQGSDELNSILAEMGFKASADRHGTSENTVEQLNGFRTLPTNMVGEPGGVAYFETLAAEGSTRQEIVATVRNTLKDGRIRYVLYDHPCYAGIRALENVRAVVKCAIDSGTEITTLSTFLREDTQHG